MKVKQDNGGAIKSERHCRCKEFTQLNKSGGNPSGAVRCVPRASWAHVMGEWSPLTCPREMSSRPPGVAAKLSVLIRAAFLGRLLLCHKLGTVQTFASRVIFFGFRKSSFTRRRQKAPCFFLPEKHHVSKAVLVSLLTTYLCVYTPQFSHVTFIKVNWRRKIKAGSKRQRVSAKSGLARVPGE